MYVEDGTNFVLSEESIALWAQNTKAYVKAVKEEMRPDLRSIACPRA